MKPEVVHGEKKDIQPKVQAQAVKLVTERGVVVAQVTCPRQPYQSEGKRSIDHALALGCPLRQ